MNKNIEKEYKILVTKDQFSTLLKNYPEAKFIEQINTYYDTENMDIRNARGAIRIRQITDTFIFTLKMHSEEGLLEFEKEVNANHISIFEDVEIQELLSTYGISGNIKEITTLTTQRAMIKTEDAELCFDMSMYNGITDYEIEYEYKKDHDGRTIFNALLASVGLHYEKNCTSKIKRAISSLSK